MSSSRCTFPALSLTLLWGTLLLPTVFLPPAIALDCDQIGKLIPQDSLCRESFLPNLTIQTGNRRPSRSPGIITAETLTSNGLQPFQGTWKFDFEKTMEAYRESPDYNPEDDFGALSGLLNLMFGMVSLTISDNQLQIGVTGSEEVTIIDCEVTSSSATAAIARCTKDGDTQTMKFENTLPGEYMKFNVLGEDECPYCIWRKVN